MSQWLKLTVTAQQRVSFGASGEHGFLTRSHPYLPGSVIRGALAAAWFRAGKQTNDPGFKEIFREGHFGPAYPVGVTLDSQSVSQCKYHDPKADHKEFADLAFGEDAARSCLAGREELKGDFCGIALINRTATALEARINQAKDGALYSRELIDKGTRFIGYIVLPDNADASFLTGNGSKGSEPGVRQAFFGGRTSVMGRSKVAIKPCDKKFNPDPGKPCVIRTLSPTILVDDYGLPSIDLAGALKKMVGVTPEGIWNENPRVESGVAGGWHLASGLPKPTEVALTQGVVVRFAKGDMTSKKLQHLLENGLGLRTNEGYGWVEVVDKAWEEPESRKEDSQSQLMSERGAQ